MDIREALEKADESLTTTEPPAPAEATETPAPVAEAAPAPESETEPAQRSRDERGRFAKGETKAPEVKEPPKAEAVPEAKPVEPAPVATKAPQSLRPAAREAWARAAANPDLAPLLEDIARREGEVPRALQDAADARRFRDSFQQHFAPYETLARANGQDLPAYLGSLAQTAAALTMGSDQQKAQVFAQLLGQFRVNTDLVNAFLQGQAPQGQPQYQQPQPDVRAVLREELQRMQGAALERRASRDLEAFQATAPEFLGDVWDRMRGILIAAGESGRNMTYRDAYDAACWADPDVRRILTQRQAAESARTSQAVTQRTRDAASSIRSHPAAPPVGAQPNSIDGALRAAAEKLGM